MTSPLLINESPLQVLPSLAVKVGLNEAIILQQIHYWLNPKFNKNHIEGRLWVYNTYEQWQEQFPFWGQKTIKRAISALEESGVLMSFLPRSFEKKKYYTINYDILNHVCEAEKPAENLGTSPSGQIVPIDQDTKNFPSGQFDPIERTKLSCSYIDTEITHEITHPPLTPPCVASGLDDHDDDVFNKMISVWNHIVQTKLNLEPLAYISENRKTKLHQIFDTLFKGDLKAWQGYCQQIGTNQFLLGGNQTGFRVTLDWALNPENACKVLEGFYFDKVSLKSAASGNQTRVFEINYEFLEEESKGRQHSEFWIQLSKTIIGKLGQNTYSSWFKSLQISRLTDKILTFEVASVFVKDYINTHYHKSLLEAARSIAPSIVRIEYSVSAPKGGFHV